MRGLYTEYCVLWMSLTRRITLPSNAILFPLTFAQHNIAQTYKRLRSWRTLTESAREDLFGMCSQMGSTSGPSRSPAPSHPQHQTVGRQRISIVVRVALAHETVRTVLGTGLECERLALFLREEAIVGPEPGAVLRVRTRVIGQPAEADIPSNSGQVAASGVDNVPHTLRRPKPSSASHRNRPI